VFLGKFDDDKYVEEMKEKYKEPPPPPLPPPVLTKKEEFIKAVKDKLGIAAPVKGKEWKVYIKDLGEMLGDTIVDAGEIPVEDDMWDCLIAAADKKFNEDAKRLKAAGKCTDRVEVKDEK